MNILTRSYEEVPASAPGPAVATTTVGASARISHQLESATEDVHTAISRVRARLLGLVQQEVKSLFQEALGGAGTAIADHVIGEGPPAPGPTFPGPSEDPVPEGDALDPLAPIEDELDEDVIQSIVALPVVPEPEATEPESAFEPVPVSDPFLDLAPQNGAGPMTGTELLDTSRAEDVYEGTVRLTVAAPGCIRLVIRFVDQLCCNPHLRLLQLVGNHRKEGVDIWLGLREPLQLRPLLLKMQGVTRVDTPLGYGPKGHERLVEVHLS